MKLNRNPKASLRFLRCAVLVVLSAVMLSGLCISAEETLEQVPGQSYYFWQNSNGKKVVPDRAVFEASSKIDGRTLGTTSFSGISDIEAAEDGKVYVLDAANGRIVVLNSDYSLFRVLDSFVQDGQPQTLNAPQGLFVEGNRIIVADTENQRLLFCNLDGQIESVLSSPSGDLIPEDFDFYPIKVTKDAKGFLYILSRGSYYGALTYDENGQFCGFYGSNPVTADVVEQIGRVFGRIFTNNEGAAYKIQKLPYQFADLCLGSDDVLFTVSPNEKSGTGQIRKLSPSGKNILSYTGGTVSKNADSINFGEEDLYETIMNRKTPQNFCGIAVDDAGYIYGLDAAYGKIYAYDSECNSISVFGGGLALGNQLGTFVTPSAIETVDGDLLVADSAKNDITVFRRTEYGKLLYQADDLSQQGEYAAAEPYWKEIMKQSGNCQLAFRGLAQAALIKEDYSSALRYARLGDDQASYEQAFEQLFNSFVSRNLWWIVVIAIIVIGGVLTFFIYSSKRQITLIKNRKLRVCLRTLIHPFESFYEIKFLKQGSVLWAVICIALYYVVTVLKSLAGGFMYGIVEKEDFNALMILGGTVGLVLLFVVANWALCSLFEGKGTFKDVLVVTAYALIPQLINGVFYIVTSHLITPSNSAIIGTVSTICCLWSAIILIVGLITVHDFSFTKTILTGILTVIGIVLMIFVLFMVLTFFQNFLSFAVSLIREASTR